MTRRPVPRLHLIGPLDGVLAAEEYAAVAVQAIAGGVDAVHVRLPGAAGGDVLQLCQRILTQQTDLFGATVFVNDRVDIAIVINAGGVQLGEHSLAVPQVRDLMGNDVLIGRSIHDVRGAIQAQADGADFVLAGHVFATGSKAGQPGRGIEWISELEQAVTIPIIAIGGISVKRVECVIGAGAWGVAIGREILTASDPAHVARTICTKMEQR